MGYLCHHTCQALGDGCPLEDRYPRELLAPRRTGKGGSSCLRETQGQAPGRESTLGALCMKTVPGSEGTRSEAGQPRPQPPPPISSPSSPSPH